MKKTLVVLFAVMAFLSLASCEQEIHTHSFDEGVVTAKPSCTSIGAKVYTCECGETKTEILQMLGHTEGPSETREATCVEKGGVYVKCTVCGQELAKRETPSLGHDWDEGETKTEATCASIGSILHTCKRCNEEKIEVVAKLAHEAGEEETTEPTCTEKGKIETKCVKCEEVLECTEIPALGHNWDAGVIKTEASCSSIGSRLHTCTRCSEEKIEIIAKLEHEEGERITTEPTCTTKGKVESKCTKCNQVIYSQELAELGHDWKFKERTLEPTCDTAGEDVYQCSRCNEEEKRSVNALGHDFSDGVKSKINPTCTSKGYEFANCKRCNKAVYETLEMLPHTPNTGNIVTEPTCTSEGEKVYRCTVCDTVTKTEVLAMLPHNLEKQNVITEPTCVVKEVALYKCKDCNHEEEKTLEVDSSVHKHTEYRLEGEPKYFTAAIDKEYCTDCGEPTGNKNEVYKSLVGFWMGEITEDTGYAGYGFVFSFHEDGSVDAGYYMGDLMEDYTQTYAVGTYEDRGGISAFGLILTSSESGEEHTSVLPYVSEDGETFTLDTGETGNVTLIRKTTEDHVHTISENYSIYNMTDGKNVTTSVHCREMTCSPTVHQTFKYTALHNFRDGECADCGQEQTYVVCVLESEEQRPYDEGTSTYVGTLETAEHNIKVYPSYNYKKYNDNMYLTADRGFNPEGKTLLLNFEPSADTIYNYLSSSYILYIKQ